MALVHEKLYQSDNFREINVRDYFNELIGELVENYNTRPEGIRCILNVDNLYLTLDILIPIGLIANEIIINSIRHAFKDCDDPEIRAELRLSGENDIVFRISDNGSGFAEELASGEGGHLGLEIVRALVIQLKGNMSIDCTKGTGFLIRFPLKN